jgi:RHS repeat-associated protein
MTLRFPGQEEDLELAMRQNFHRIFRQSEGRYTQMDPIGTAGGLNRVVYAEGDSVNKIDPMGLKAEPGDTALNLPTHNCSCMEKCLQASHNEAYEACAVPSAWFGRLTKIPGSGLLLAAFCKKAYTENQCKQMCGDFCSGKGECPPAFRD